MDIAFIEPKSRMEGFTFGWINRMFMLGPAILGTILHNQGHNVRVYKEKLFTPDYSKLDVDVLGIYTMTSTANRAYEIAKEVRESHPGTKIIIGGPHASFMTAEAKAYADIVVSGEAEPIIGELVNSRKKGIVRAEKCVEMDTVPPVDFSLVKGIGKKLNPMPIQTSRGCPFNCNFCSVTEMFGRKYRFKKTENVINEMLSNDYKRMYIYDDNFCAIPSRAKEIMRQMKDYGLTRPWMAQTRIDVAKDEELLKLMSETNCDMLSIGLESIDDKTLQWFNKSQTSKNLKQSVRKLQDHGIKVHGMFVFGSDAEDKNAIKRTTEFCDDVDMACPSATLLTPLPGTRLFREFDEQKRIINKDWDFYNFSHLVFKPRNIEASRLQDQYFEFSKKLYWFRKRGFRLWFDQFPHLVSSIRVLKGWADQNRRYAEHLRSMARMHG